MKACIVDPFIQIRPTKKVINYLKDISDAADLPVNVAKICKKEKTQTRPKAREYLLDDGDYNFINSLDLNAVDKKVCGEPVENKNIDLLKLEDFRWLYDRLDEGIYLHELFEGSEILLPENSIVPRSEELEKRCQFLKEQQQNMEYKAMTKNIDNVRKRHPEDTIAYQIKQINRQLIAIAQFTLSVLAGFAFGFIGIELFIGNLDFGFRLLLGVICALVIALAELYFLAKKLNEDLQFETATKVNTKNSKIN